MTSQKADNWLERILCILEIRMASQELWQSVGVSMSRVTFLTVKGHCWKHIYDCVNRLET